MKTFVEQFNESAKVPVSDKDIASLSEPSKDITAKACSIMNEHLRKVTNSNYELLEPAKFNHKKEDHILEVLAIPGFSKATNSSSMRVIAAVRDLKAIDEPKFYVLTQYDLATATKQDVISGLILSLVDGPMRHLTYMKLRINVLKEFMLALDKAFTKQKGK